MEKNGCNITKEQCNLLAETRDFWEEIFKSAEICCNENSEILEKYGEEEHVYRNIFDNFNISFNAFQQFFNTGNITQGGLDMLCEIFMAEEFITAFKQYDGPLPEIIEDMGGIEGIKMHLFQEENRNKIKDILERPEDIDPEIGYKKCIEKSGGVFLENGDLSFNGQRIKKGEYFVTHGSVLDKGNMLVYIDDKRILSYYVIGIRKIGERGVLGDRWLEILNIQEKMEENGWNCVDDNNDTRWGEYTLVFPFINREVNNEQLGGFHYIKSVFPKIISFFKRKIGTLLNNNDDGEMSSEELECIDDFLEGKSTCYLPDKDGNKQKKEEN